MSIYLNVRDYCQNCNEFQVDVLQYQHGNTDTISTDILCKHRDKCKAIYEYLHKDLRFATTRFDYE